MHMNKYMVSVVINQCLYFIHRLCIETYSWTQCSEIHLLLPIPRENTTVFIPKQRKPELYTACSCKHDAKEDMRYLRPIFPNTFSQPRSDWWQISFLGTKTPFLGNGEQAEFSHGSRFQQGEKESQGTSHFFACSKHTKSQNPTNITQEEVFRRALQKKRIEHRAAATSGIPALTWCAATGLQETALPGWEPKARYRFCVR